MEFESVSKQVSVKTAQGIMNYTIEQRIDPLLKYSSVVCEHLLDKWGDFYGNRDEKFIEKFVEESRKNCPFCRPVIDKIAARFLKSQMDEEIVKFNDGENKSDDVYVFPNIYPRVDFDAVVTMPDVHYLNLDEFNAGILKKFLSAEIGCIKKAYNKNKDLTYANIGWNYMFPSGASLTHLHMQIAMRDNPFSYIALLINASKEYKKSTGGNYWEDLMKQKSKRKIFSNKQIYIYAPFAPRGFSEVRGVVNKPNLAEINDEDIREISIAMGKILNYYHEEGFSSFNFAMFSDRINNSNSSLPVSFSIYARPSPREVYMNIDTWFMPFLLQECIVLEKPENLAKKLREKFKF